jgi:uncharacterized membrane protein YphA (DoxX/SURF4 family)
MFIDFKDYAGIGIIALLILGFLMVCGLFQAAPAFMAILFMTGLAVYFGNKNG